MVRDWARALQTLADDVGDVGLGEGRVGAVEALVDGDVVSHLADPALVDAQLAQVHRDADARKEVVGGGDGALRDLAGRQGRIDSEDIDAILHEAR